MGDAGRRHDGHGPTGAPPAPTGRRDPATLVALERAVSSEGPTDAPALLLLHGTRRTRAMWRLQLDGLADAFRVLALDLPGHGALADVPFRLADASALAAAAIEDFGDGRAVVVGSSLGGYVGMDLAARRPELVAGLVIVNASAEPRSVARRAPATIGAYLARAAADSLQARDQPPGRPGDGGAAVAAAHADAGAVQGDASEPPATRGLLFRGGGRALVDALRESFRPRLAAFSGPTLILNGADDVLFRSGEQAFLAVAADGRLELIDGTGHLANEERPEAFNEAIRRFAAAANGGPPPRPDA